MTDVGNLNQVNNTNWEFFASDGYPFYMPGHVGPAWQNTETSETYTNLPMIIGLTDVSKVTQINILEGYVKQGDLLRIFIICGRIITRAPIYGSADRSDLV